MPVNISIHNQFFCNQWDNGSSLTSNQLNPWITTFLMGNCGELLRTVIEVDISWTSESSATDVFNVIGNTITRSGSGDFEADGFQVGDIIDLWELSPLTLQANDRTITSISPTQIDFSGAPVPSYLFVDGIIYGKTPLESLIFNYGLIENLSPTNFISQIDGTASQEFFAGGIGIDTGGGVRDTSEITMTSATGVNSWKDDGSIKVNYEQTLTQAGAFAQRFKIQHIFRLLPYFLDSWQPNLITLVPPNPQFNSTSCLKYVFNTEFREALANPNGAKAQSFGSVSGNTGWFDEKFNGFTNDFSIQSVSIVDTISGVPLADIDCQTTCTVTIVVNSNNSVFLGDAVNISVGVSKQALQSEYQQNLNTVQENFVFDYLITNIANPPISSDFIQDYDITGSTGATATLQFNINYNPNQEAKCIGKDYLIFVGVADQSGGALGAGVNANRVMLLAKIGSYISTTDEPDLMFVDDFKFVPHDLADTSPAIKDDYKGWIEDGLQIQAPFKLNTDDGSQLTYLSLDLIAYNESTEQQFTIQSNPFDLTGSVIVGGVQQLTISGQNNFKLNSASDFLKIEVGNSGSGTVGLINVEEYDLKRGVRINYEEWIQLLGADAQYFNASQLFNGYNLLTSNYSTTYGFVPPNQYKVRARLNANVLSNSGVTTNYQFLSEPLDIYYYGKDSTRFPHQWSCDIEIYDVSGNLIDVILTDAECDIKATFSKNYPFVDDLIEPWGWIRLDVQQGDLNTPWELSTINPRLITGNPLIPLPAETFCKVTNNGANVILECRVDPTNLPSGSVLSVSARLSESNGALPVVWELYDCEGASTYYTSTDLTAYIGQTIWIEFGNNCYSVIGTSNQPADFPAEPIVVIGTTDDCAECFQSAKITESGTQKYEEDGTKKIIE